MLLIDRNLPCCPKIFCFCCQKYSNIQIDFSSYLIFCRISLFLCISPSPRPAPGWCRLGGRLVSTLHTLAWSGYWGNQGNQASSLGRPLLLAFPNTLVPVTSYWTLRPLQEGKNIRSTQGQGCKNQLSAT